MKIVHLSTHDQRGGAARAAWRLHEGLNAAGIDSRMVVRTKDSEDDRVDAIADGALIARWHEQVATPWLQRQLPKGSSWLTVGCVQSFVHEHPWIQEADVLHLHWVAEWLSAEAVGALMRLGKPVVWTFHDLWPVTGGSHFAGSNAPMGDAWQTGADLPHALSEVTQREFLRKQAAGFHCLGISPSRWLAKVVNDSRIGAHWPIEVIPNGIPMEHFTPGDQAEARQRWQLPQDHSLLLFGCHALNEQRKGFSALCDALLQLPTQDKVTLVLFGGDSPALPSLPLPVQHLGVIKGEADMASVYRSGDAFLCPALEDNLPSTVLESLACGTPVLGFATGGIPDMVVNKVNGLLAPCGDASALAQVINRFLTDTLVRADLQQAARNIDKTSLSVSTQVERMVGFYKSATAREVQPPPRPAGGCDLLPSETSWLMHAVAEALHASDQQTQKFKAKLDKMKHDKAKAKAAKKEPPPPPKRRWWWR